MIDRIRTILEAKNLTSTQFSESTGINKSILSHILSGRNNPSLDVVQKITEAFQDISLDWLVNGKGEMYQKPAPGAVPKSAGLPDFKDNPNQFSSERKVVKIVFFYDDNSFTEFSPK